MTSSVAPHCLEMVGVQRELWMNRVRGNMNPLFVAMETVIIISAVVQTAGWDQHTSQVSETGVTKLAKQAVLVILANKLCIY